MIEANRIPRLRLVRVAKSSAAYELRDFLQRSVVAFDWIELQSDADCQRELGVSSLAKARLPVVELPDGTRLEEPTVRELANRLGWVTQPRFKEYDVSIYGVGPAGLSTAVCEASEGLRTVFEGHAIGGQAAPRLSTFRVHWRGAQYGMGQGHTDHPRCIGISDHRAGPAGEWPMAVMLATQASALPPRNLSPRLFRSRGCTRGVSQAPGDRRRRRRHGHYVCS